MEAIDGATGIYGKDFSAGALSMAASETWKDPPHRRGAGVASLYSTAKNWDTDPAKWKDLFTQVTSAC